MKKIFTWFIAGIILLSIAPALVQALLPSLMEVFIRFILPVALVLGAVLLLILVLKRTAKKKPPAHHTEIHHHHYPH